MDTIGAQDDLSFLLQRHAELEANYGDGDGGRFLSGWQCENPWADRIRELVEQQSRKIDSTEYLYTDSDDTIRRELFRFHQNVDGVSPPDLLCGAGATTIIFTFCAWLRQQDIREVFYIPPLYFTLHFALRLFGVRARAVSGRHAFEDGFSINLPPQRAVLLLADPIWYAGLSLNADVIAALVEWQRLTHSLVFVDGSFQYARWDGSRRELSAQFSPEWTVRLICPTKALAVHGYRFAYAALPADLRTTFAHIYTNIYGSSSIESLSFAKIAPGLMADGTITRSLMALVSERHKSLRERKKIAAPWQPTCGYFIFERVTTEPPPGGFLMDGSYFQQKRYPEFRRLNLLSPSLHLLD